MPFSKLLIAAVVASALPFLSASSPACAQISKKAKERGAPVADAASGGLTKQRRLSLCLESWDAQTHMSKREWRVACERSLKDYPDAFN